MWLLFCLNQVCHIMIGLLSLRMANLTKAEGLFKRIIWTRVCIEWSLAGSIGAVSLLIWLFILVEFECLVIVCFESFLKRDLVAISCFLFLTHLKLHRHRLQFASSPHFSLIPASTVLVTTQFDYPTSNLLPPSSQAPLLIPPSHSSSS